MTNKILKICNRRPLVGAGGAYKRGDARRRTVPGFARKWEEMSPSRLKIVELFLKTTPRRHFWAIAMKQSCYLFSKIYFLLKFQPSRWTMAPSTPIFFWQSLNKLPQGGILEQLLWSKAAIRFQKYTTSSNFSLLRGPWLRPRPFSRFGH